METLTFLFTSTFYPPYHVGGDAVHVQYLAEELASAGHEVHVLHSIDAYNLKCKTSPKQSGFNGTIVHPIKTAFNLSAYSAFFLGGSSKILSEYHCLIEKIKPDVVHHHNISLLGYNLLKKRGNYLEFYTAHDYWLICQKNSLSKDGLNFCDAKRCFACSIKSKRPPQIWRSTSNFNFVLKDIDTMIAPSNYMANKLTTLGVSVVTIANFAPNPPVLHLELSQKNYVLFVGVLEVHKGVLDLLGAFKAIADKVEYDLIIVGSGSLYNKIKTFLKQNCLEHRVNLLGWINHDLLYPLLSKAKAIVIPSICQENCPIVALEALSVGTPVIGSNNGGLPEIIEKLDPTLIYPSPNKLVPVLLSIEKRQYSKANVQAVYAENFSPSAYIHAYFDLLKNRQS